MKGTGGRTRATCAIAVTARQNAAIATGADTPPPAAPPTPATLCADAWGAES